METPAETMNFHQLLQHRAALLRQARLANLAFACERLDDYARRLAAARISGPLTLQGVDPEADRFCPELVPHVASQAVVDEYFLDEDVADLADVLGFLGHEGFDVAATFTSEDVMARWLPRLRRELAAAGIAPPTENLPLDDTTSESGASGPGEIAGEA